MEKLDKIIISDLFVERMEKYRCEQRLTQAQFAARLDLSLSGYKNILNYRTKAMSYDRYLKLADSTKKIFWLAFLFDKSLIPLADAFDEYDYAFHAKIDCFIDLFKEIQKNPPTATELTEIVESIRETGRFITSRSFQYLAGLPADRPLSMKKENYWNRYDMSKDTSNKRLQEFSFRLERCRIEMGKTQAEFAKMLDYSLSGYKKLLSQSCRTIGAVDFFYYTEMLNKISFLTIILGDKLDCIAVALDESNLEYDIKLKIMDFFGTLYDEFGLTQEYIDGVVYRIKHLGEHYEQLDGICKANP